jgi:hypothetical protein
MAIEINKLFKMNGLLHTLFGIKHNTIYSMASCGVY